MSQPSLDALFNALTPVVRPVMLQHFVPNCCVATCRVLRHVFTRYGYASEAVPVETAILNAKMIELLRQGPLPKDKQERSALFERTGAWGIGMTQEAVGISRKGFPGHVVLNVDGLLVDASLGQADRPEKDISMPPLLVCNPEGDFFAKKHRDQSVTASVNRCSVTYTRLNNFSFRQGRDWVANGSPYNDALRQIIDRTEENLKRKDGN